MRSQSYVLLVAMALTAWSGSAAQLSSSEDPPEEVLDSVVVEATVGSETFALQPGRTVTDVREIWIHAPGERIVAAREFLANGKAYSLLTSDGFCLALSYPLGMTAPDLAVSTGYAGSTTVRVAEEGTCLTCLTVRDRWYDPQTTNELHDRLADRYVRSMH